VRDVAGDVDVAAGDVERILADVVAVSVNPFGICLKGVDRVSVIPTLIAGVSSGGV
jgi:hypothetical protein